LSLAPQNICGSTPRAPNRRNRRTRHLHRPSRSSRSSKRMASVLPGYDRRMAERKHHRQFSRSF
ncbi:hypothetical protein FRB90_010482, partial [Tulasnella sp. 427]